MKKNKILLAILASACIGTTAGCGGESKYQIKANVTSNEFGYVRGGGKYEAGQKVSLKVYPNEGCTPNGFDFKRVGSEDINDIAASALETVTDDEGKTLYYKYEFDVNAAADVGTVGTYTAKFSCLTNTTDDVANATAAERKVQFMVVGEETDFENNPLIPSQIVKLGNKIAKEINYIDSVEGRIKWYKVYNEETGAFSEPWNFAEDAVLSDITLYGNVETATPLEIVKDAIENFKNNTKMEMIMNDKAATVKSFNKASEGKMDFNFYQGTVSNPAGNHIFMIHEGDYYSIISGVYYKLDLEDSGFTIDDIDAYTQFFEHLTFDLSDGAYTVEKVGNEDVLAKDTNNNDVSVTGCSKYTLKNNESVVMTFWIKNGEIYKTQNAEGNVNVIIHPEGEIGAVDPSVVKDLYLIKLSSNNTELKGLLNEINSDFQKVLMLKANSGETIEYLFENNTNVKDLLRKYDYTISYSGGTIDPATHYVDGNRDLVLNVKGEYSDVKDGIEVLKEGGFKITTTGEIFGDIVSKEYTVADATNILAESTNPGMNPFIWDVIQTVKTLEDDYYKFSYENDVYSFYEKNGDSIPYITIKLSGSGFVEEIVYYETNAAGKVTTYTSVIEYLA
jgi:hypothetical protein